MNLNNIAMALLTTVTCFMAGWVLQINTEVALLDQRIEAEEGARKSDFVIIRSDQNKNEQNTEKMAETMINIDKTLSILVDRLERAEIVMNPSVAHTEVDSTSKPDDGGEDLADLADKPKKVANNDSHFNKVKKRLCKRPQKIIS